MMTTKPALRHWRYAEFARLPDDGKRYEIIAGELVVSPSPHHRHQLASIRIAGVFENFTRDHGIGQIYGPLDVLLSGSDYLIPDLVLVRHERRAILSDRGLEGPPDLVIEIVSPSSSLKDQGLKRERYALFGVPLYWVVDTTLRQIEVYRLAEDPSGPAQVVTDTLIWHPVPGRPALTLSVPFVVDAEGGDG
jgi:Uma2 family endonuclease